MKVLENCLIYPG